MRHVSRLQAAPMGRILLWSAAFRAAKNYFTLEAEKRPGSDAGAVEDTRL